MLPFTFEEREKRRLEIQGFLRQTAREVSNREPPSQDFRLYGRNSYFSPKEYEEFLRRIILKYNIDIIGSREKLREYRKFNKLAKSIAYDPDVVFDEEGLTKQLEEACKEIGEEVYYETGLT